jgi:hypothetical protein
VPGDWDPATVSKRERDGGRIEMGDESIRCGACGAANPAVAVVCVACGALLAPYQTPEGATESDGVPHPAEAAPPEPVATPPIAEPKEPTAVMPEPETTEAESSAFAAEPTEIAAEPMVLDLVEEQLEESPESETGVLDSVLLTTPPAPKHDLTYGWPPPRRPARARPVAQIGSATRELRLRTAAPPVEHQSTIPPERLIAIGASLLIGSCALVSVTRSTAGAGCFVGLGMLAAIAGLVLIGGGVNAITGRRSS